MKYIPIVLFSLCSFTAFSKTGNLSGKIITQDAKPANNTTLLILHAKDSTLAKTTIVNSDGIYTAESLSDGQYLVKAMLAGYETIFSAPITIAGANETSPDLKLLNEKKDLKK